MDLISPFQMLLLAFCGWVGLRLWEGTTSFSARIAALGSLAFLVWTFVGP